MTKLEKAVIDAAVGKQWELLALWLDMRFPLDKTPEIQRDLRKLGRACARYSVRRAAKKGKK